MKSWHASRAAARRRWSKTTLPARSKAGNDVIVASILDFDVKLHTPNEGTQDCANSRRDPPAALRGEALHRATKQ